MNRSAAVTLFVSGFFLVLLTNLAGFSFGLVGIHGIAFYHLQLLLVGGSILHVALLVLAGHFQTHTVASLLRLVLCSIAYTVVSCVLLLRFSDIVPGYVAMMLYTYLIYPVSAVALLVCSRRDTNSANQMLPAWLPWAAMAILVFGWLQFAFRDTFIHLANTENVSKLVETNLLGTFRPPSVFESSFQYGLFSVLVLSLSSGSALFGSGARRAWLLASVALISVAISQTRNVFLCAAASLGTLCLIRISGPSRKPIRILRLIPLAYVAASITVLFLAVRQFLDSDLARTQDLTDASSALSRVSGWLTACEQLVLPGSVFDALFGYGITQAGHASDFHNLYPVRGEGLFIDNTFVNLFLFQGLIGLAFFLAIYWTIWRRLLRKLQSTPDPFVIGVTCFFSAFLAVGVLNIVNGQWWGITFALSLIALADRRSSESPCAPLR